MSQSRSRVIESSFAVDALDGPMAAGAPLGPDSLLWGIASDWRCLLSGAAAGVLQLMWPHLGRGVVEHSRFFVDPAERVFRSIPQIWATIYADESDGRGRRIRNLHRSIKGIDERGCPYSALDADTFWWAHATFTWEMFQTVDRWDARSLTPAQRRRLYAETVTWYRRYGLPETPVPLDDTAFFERFAYICRTDLQMTPAAERAIDIALHEPVRLPGVPAGLTTAASPGLRRLVIGSLPTVVRERFDIPWSGLDQLGFDATVVAVRAIGRSAPRPLNRGAFSAFVRYMESMAPSPGRTGSRSGAASRSRSTASGSTHARASGPDVTR